MLVTIVLILAAVALVLFILDRLVRRR